MSMHTINVKSLSKNNGLSRCFPRTSQRFNNLNDFILTINFFECFSFWNATHMFVVDTRFWSLFDRLAILEVIFFLKKPILFFFVCKNPCRTKQHLCVLPKMECKKNLWIGDECIWAIGRVASALIMLLHWGLVTLLHTGLVALLPCWHSFRHKK